jgi:nickel-dependent lactate racemase
VTLASGDPVYEEVEAAALTGGSGTLLSREQVLAFVEEQLGGDEYDGRSVCVVVPDATRSCPLPLLVEAVHSALHGRVTRLTVLVALGTHAPMSPAQLARHLGCEEGGVEERFPGTEVRNHEWQDRATFVTLGSISGARVAALSDGRLDEDVEVRLNRAVAEHDVSLVVGPVFPHEVVGFSGGNKYFFPGVGGQEVIDVSHWLGALITSATLIGSRGVTPVRALIDEAAALVPSRRRALCLVVRPGTTDLHALSYGPPETAWAACAEVSAEAHVTYLDEPVRRVVSVVPERYDDLWTGAKGFYKVEPVVADGGEVVLLAPHITEVAAMHPVIERIGYHCRDYFLGQWDRFRDEPRGDLAHSTHLRGAGTWDAEHGERCRVAVSLATGIPEDVVRRIGLGYVDPASLDLEQEEADPGTLLVREAGEVLYRLRRA